MRENHGSKSDITSAFPMRSGGNDTVEPENVHKEIKALLIEYNGKKNHSRWDIIDLHQRCSLSDANGSGDGS